MSPAVHAADDPELFPRLPEEQVRRLEAYGTEVRLPEGELLFREDEPPQDFFVVLAGRLEVAKTIGGERTLLAVHGRGEFTGDLSLITRRSVTADARALEDVRLCRIAAADFHRVMTDLPDVAAVVFRATAGRGAELDATLQQSARMAALGTLAAGLAHELGNPAAAAARAAGQLEDALGRVEGATAQLAALGLPGDAVARAGALLGPLELDGRDALARADAEDALAERLAACGVRGPSALAGELVDAGLDAGAVAALVAAPGEGVALDGERAEALLRWVAAAADARALAGELRDAAHRVSELVATMRGYTRLDEAPVQEVDLAEAVETTLGVLGARLGPGIVVERDFDRALPPVPARGAELNQVWTVLLDNALDAMGERGVLRVATRREGARALVEIRDSGPGVPEELGARILEPFFTTKDVGQGAGLGLDAARRIVAVRHGGELSFRSRPGDTRFTVALPLAGLTEGD